MFSGEDIFNLCYFVLSIIKHYLDLAKRTESSHEARISFQNKLLGWEHILERLVAWQVFTVPEEGNLLTGHLSMAT